MLRLGRFLDFMPTGINLQNLTERRFRDYWERTDKAESNERVRFRAVAELMAEDMTLSRSTTPKMLGGKIKEQFCDGKWHRFGTIAAAIDAPEDRETALEAAGTSHLPRPKAGPP